LEKFSLVISVRHGVAGGAVAFPTLENLPLFWQKFSTFRQITQLHPHLSEVVSILSSDAKALQRLFCHSVLPQLAKQTLPLSEHEAFGNSNRLPIWTN